MPRIARNVPVPVPEQPLAADLKPETHGPIPAADRARSKAAARAHGRSVTSLDGKVIRTEEWRARKEAHVNRIHEFARRYPSMGAEVLTLLSDINFSRGVYARSEVMSLVNDYLGPTDPKTGKPASREWAAYMQACDRGASEKERATLFFRAHNEALERAKADPCCAAARRGESKRELTLCDATLKAAEDLEKEVNKPGVDTVPAIMGGVGGWMKAHARAGVMPITPGDLDLVMRASDMSPLERMMDRIRGESSDEPLMARGMQTMMRMQETWLRNRLDVVRSIGRKLLSLGR